MTRRQAAPGCFSRIPSAPRPRRCAPAGPAGLLRLRAQGRRKLGSVGEGGTGSPPPPQQKGAGIGIQGQKGWFGQSEGRQRTRVIAFRIRVFPCPKRCVALAAVRGYAAPPPLPRDALEGGGGGTRPPPPPPGSQANAWPLSLCRPQWHLQPTVTAPNPPIQPPPGPPLKPLPVHCTAAARHSSLLGPCCLPHLSRPWPRRCLLPRDAGWGTTRQGTGLGCSRGERGPCWA